MPNSFSGVFPCYENQFKVGAAGAQTLKALMTVWKNGHPLKQRAGKDV